VVLTVQDSGPGLAPHELQRLGERFFRAHADTQPGSGLGWSIVRRIASAHGAELDVSRSPTLGGLLVEVLFPASASS
jgi:two-component system sensor histidine kinase QseC